MPLFFYVLHIYLVHTLAVYVALAYKQRAAWLLYGGPMMLPPPRGYGHNLPFIYAMWLALLFAMYPLCWWYAEVKERHADWWLLRYL